MSIKRNRYFSVPEIKRFPLKATASALLTLNAEAVMAQNCPTEIFGNSLAGVICNFNGVAPSGNSVTVENGGTVGSIRMANYQPTDSYITVDAGGQVSNATGIGISVTSSASLSNGLSNNGTISAQSGIGVADNSEINGAISNSGLISAVDAGVSVNTSIVSNGLSNTGTINSASGVGIVISNTSTINGRIFNSGMINAHTTAVTIGSNSIISGDIFNSGMIESNIATGIRIITSVISGSIFNSGTISGGGIDSGISIITNSIINGDITNQGLINATNGNAIDLNQSLIHGGISNNGRIESTNVNGIYVGNISTIQGNITNSGILSGGQNGISILSGSTVNGIANNGTLSGGNNGLNITSSTINGNLSNTGTISGASTGVSISSGTVSGGMSNSGIIQGNTFAISIGNGTVSNIDILGQSARVIGAVHAVNTDVNITSGAVFTSEGTYNVDNFNIATNAMFNMANSITTAAGLNNSGTLAIGNTVLTLNGMYIQNTGGVFQTGLTSNTSYGQLLVTNSVDLSQSGNINVQIAPNFIIHNGEIFTNVISGSTLVLPTNGFNVSDNSFIWEFTASQNTNGVNLAASLNPAVNNACQGSYCQGAASVIIEEIIAGNSQFNPYALVSTESEFQVAASQATPELTSLNMQMIQLIARSVVNTLPMWGNLSFQSAENAMAKQYWQGMRHHFAWDSMSDQPNIVWVKPYGATINQNERSSVNGFTATAYGLVVGKDLQRSENWLLGGALALGEDRMHGKATLSGQSTNSTAYQGMVYGAKKLPNHLNLSGQALVGFESNHSKREIPLYASRAKGSYDSWFTNIRGELGQRYVMNQNLILTPKVDASYLYISQEGYQEYGSPMDLKISDNNNSSLVLGAYCDGAYSIESFNNQQDLILTGYGGIADDVINSQPQITSTFVAGGPGFSTPGIQLNGAVFRGGAGILITGEENPLSVHINYDIQLGNDAFSGIGTATIRYLM